MPGISQRLTALIHRRQKVHRAATYAAPDTPGCDRRTNIRDRHTARLSPPRQNPARDQPGGIPAATCPWKLHDAAYLFDALSPQERSDFHVHLAHCHPCATALDEVSGLPALLSRLPATAFEWIRP